jgi:hypothetical protein
MRSPRTHSRSIHLRSACRYVRRVSDPPEPTGLAFVELLKRDCSVVIGFSVLEDRPTLCAIAWRGGDPSRRVRVVSALGPSVLITPHRPARRLKPGLWIFTFVSGRFARTNASDSAEERRHHYVALEVLNRVALVVGQSRTVDQCTRRPVADRCAKLRRWRSSSRSRASDT